MGNKETKNKLLIKNQFGYIHQNPEAVLDEATIQKYKEEYGIKTDVHRSCINCQIRQIEKYKSMGATKFDVDCEYIPKGLPKGSAATIKQLSEASEIPFERAKKLVLSTIDPVSWAELMLGFSDDNENWFIRSYQKEQLRCSSKRFVIREGRRSGKTFAICLKLVYYMFNHMVNKGYDSNGKEIIEGPSIMIVTPYQAQLTTIFDEMESLIKRNPELKAQVDTGAGDSLYVKTPTYKMELKNGASIRGFVSGLGVKQDGSGGGTMRGQSADIIYMDEMDMIPEDIIDKVVTPILLTKPGVRLIATSTPIGKRAKFYQWCLERPDFKEDYYPSSVLPHWANIVDELVRENTDEGFRAEYMAEFIEGSFGVFKPSWVIEAKRDYDYEDTCRSNALEKFGVGNISDMTKCIGIDWNKNAGTEFYVMGYSNQRGVWVALDAVNVPATKFSAKRWMEEVVRLNFKWNPEYIYADEGYGHTIIEDLKLYSHRMKMKENKNQRDISIAKIGDRLVSYNFSRNVEIRDPVDGKKITKSGKHFLVENAVRIFEDKQVIIPFSDETIAKQMMNYTVLRRNPQNNKPVYGMDNKNIGDHRLDAMMLALAGLTLEESVYSTAGPSEISLPEFIGKEEDAQWIELDSHVSSLKKGIERTRVPRAFNILKIMRGDVGSEQYIENNNYNNYERKSRSEPFKQVEESGILESIHNKNNNFRPSQPQMRGPSRKGRGRRSWK